MDELTDVRYEVEDGLAWIVIDRPDRMNAFRARTVDELINCFKRAWASSRSVSSASPAPVSAPSARAGTRSSGPRQAITAPGLGPVRDRVPPSADSRAAQAGDRSGQRLRDRRRARTARALRPDDRRRHAVFGQTGPRVGSFDAGFGTAYLARVVGEKRARDLVPLSPVRRRHGRALGVGEPRRAAAGLRAEVRRWADEILALSPTALRFLKQSFNADSEHLAGLGQLAFSGLERFLDSEEAREGVRAFESASRTSAASGQEPRPADAAPCHAHPDGRQRAELPHTRARRNGPSHRAPSGAPASDVRPALTPTRGVDAAEADSQGRHVDVHSRGIAGPPLGCRPTRSSVETRGLANSHRCRCESRAGRCSIGATASGGRGVLRRARGPSPGISSRSVNDRRHSGVDVGSPQ